jgi:hypothetical protein
VAELALILLWSAWIGRGYLTLDRFVWPAGREFGSQVISNHFWVQLRECGSCALWNGMINGGMPALGDVFGSTLTPVVGLATLLFGVVTGARVAVIAALMTAGVAQWWIAHSLRLGSVARVWSAMLVVVAGHLAARLEGGAVGLTISTAMASLAFAAALALGVFGTRRLAVVLGLLGAATITAGQGYLQASLIGVSPAFLFLVLEPSGRVKRVWREYLLAFGLSLVLAAVFLIPALHFSSNWFKAIDPAFQAAQPFEYIPLNLVIRDSLFLQSSVLGKLPYPYLYSLFIGWVPMILAVLCLPLAQRRDAPALLCLATAAFLALFMASAIPLRWLTPLAPSLAGFRHVPLFAGLAVPPILGLSAYGLDRVLRLDWPRIALRGGGQAGTSTRSISLAWLLVVPLLGSLRTPAIMAQAYLRTANFATIYQDVERLRTDSLEWVATPFGEHFWIEPALEAGFKVSNVVWAWNWIDRPLPSPRLAASRVGPPPNASLIGQMGDIPVYEDGLAEFASVRTGTAVVPCRATGGGGQLAVECTTENDGQLVLQENAWNGWKAWIDGAPAQLSPGPRLSLTAPAGTHQYLFRYMPWDVPLGLLVTLLGFGVVGFLLLRSRRSPESDQDPNQGS